MLSNNIKALVANVALSFFNILVLIPIAKDSRSLEPFGAPLALVFLIFVGYKFLKDQGTFFRNLLSVSIIGIIFFLGLILLADGVPSILLTICSTHVIWFYNMIKPPGHVKSLILCVSLMPTLLMSLGIYIRRLHDEKMVSQSQNCKDV